MKFDHHCLAGEKQSFSRPCLMHYAFILCPLFLHFHGHLNAKLIVCQGPNKVPLKLFVGLDHDQFVKPSNLITTNWTRNDHIQGHVVVWSLGGSMPVQVKI